MVDLDSLNNFCSINYSTKHLPWSIQKLKVLILFSFAPILQTMGSYTDHNWHFREKFIERKLFSVSRCMIWVQSGFSIPILKISKISNFNHFNGRYQKRVHRKNSSSVQSLHPTELCSVGSDLAIKAIKHCICPKSRFQPKTPFCH